MRQSVSQRPRRPHGLSIAEAFAFFMPGEPPPAGQVWAWTGSLDENGYGTLRHDNRNHFAHRVAYELFVGPIADGMIVRHRNDTPVDVNPHNLELGSLADNVDDRDRRGRTDFWKGRPVRTAQQVRGMAHSAAKLTDADVVAIRSRYATGKVRQTALAAEYGVSQLNISFIVRRRTWRHLP